MGLKHVAVSQKQWYKMWDSLFPVQRYFDEDSDRAKAGCKCVRSGNLLVFVDPLIPEDQVSDEVSDEIFRLRGRTSEERYEPINTAREDQKTVTFVCHDCGCLVRSDYAGAHDKKCGTPQKER
jgi:hypothetical protein